MNTNLTIDVLKNRPKDKPFFLMSHHKAPHREWTPDEKNRLLFAGKKIPEPATLRDDYRGRADAFREQQQSVFNDVTRRDLKLKPPAGLAGQELQKWLAVKPAEVEVEVDGLTRILRGEELNAWKYQRYMQDYLACVQSVDDNVGRLLDWLDANPGAVRPASRRNPATNSRQQTAVGGRKPGGSALPVVTTKRIFGGLLGKTGKENPAQIRRELRTLMDKHAGVYRTGASMKEGLDRIAELKQRFNNISVQDKSRVYNSNLIQMLETENKLDLAEVLLFAGLAREESRGAHSRTDCLNRDDQKFLAHSMVYRTGGKPRLEYKPVTITMWKPVERKY